VGIQIRRVGVSTRGKFCESLGLEYLWESEEVGDKVAWNSLISTVIKAKEEKDWEGRMRGKPKLCTYRKLKFALEFEEYLEESDREGEDFLRC